MKPLTIMNQEPMPQGGKPGSNRKKNYPNTPAGIRLQLKGEIWLDTYAVMEQFRVSLKSVERYRKRHGLRCSRIGQRRYFSETALLQFFKDHEEPGEGGRRRGWEKKPFTILDLEPNDSIHAICRIHT